MRMARCLANEVKFDAAGIGRFLARPQMIEHEGKLGRVRQVKIDLNADDAIE